MEKIQLPNRDGANLWLVKIKKIDSDTSEWKLDVDNNHKYCLEYCRYIGKFDINNKTVDWRNIEAIDPSGGPMLSLGNEFKNKYKIIKINSINSIIMSEKL